MPENVVPSVSDDVLAAHSAEVDARLEGLIDDEPPSEEGGGFAMADEPDELAEPNEPETSPEMEGEEPESVEVVEDNDQPVAPSDTSLLTARVALKRDGWSEGDINSLSQDAWLERGLARAEAQSKNDEVYSERDRLRSQLGITPREEPNEEQPGASDPQGASDPNKAGVDLTSLAGPVAEAISEMEDPAEVASHLASFAQKAVQTEVQGLQQTLNGLLEARAKERIAGRYEGDLTTLQEAAGQLGAAGRHSDKTGLDRFDSLLEDALALHGGTPASQNNNTSSAPSKRGARRPVGGKTPVPKPRSREELIDARIARIERGEQDVQALRSMR